MYHPGYLHYSPPVGVISVQAGTVIEVPHERAGWEPYRITVKTVRPCSGSVVPAAWAWGLDQASRGRLVCVSAPLGDPSWPR